MLIENCYSQSKKLNNKLRDSVQKKFYTLLGSSNTIEESLNKLRDIVDDLISNPSNLLSIEDEVNEIKNNNELEDYIETEKELAKTKWFMFSPLVQMTLPHRNIDSLSFERNNGISNITWVSKEKVPFGTHARLMLIYASSMAVKSSSPIINLSPSRKGLCRDLGLTPSGPLMKSLNLQLNRLRASMLTMEEINIVENQKKIIQFNNHRIFSGGSLWWDDDYIKDGACLTFSPEFYHALKESAVPLCKEKIMKFKSSCLDLDMYMFLTYRSRVGQLKSPIPWSGLFHQIGANHANLSEFARDVKKSIIKVSPYIDGYSFSELPNGLLIRKK